MTNLEDVHLQRVLTLLSLGICEALKADALSDYEAGRILFAPRVISFCKKIHADRKLIHLIEMGTELDDIRTIVGLDEWNLTLDRIRANAIQSLKKTDGHEPPDEFWLDWLDGK